MTYEQNIILHISDNIMLKVFVITILLSFENNHEHYFKELASKKPALSVFFSAYEMTKKIVATIPLTFASPCLDNLLF